MKKTIVALLAMAGMAHAADYIWTGNAGDNKWGNSGNWAVGGEPNGYYPQSGSDTAIINDGDYKITWTSEQPYFGASNEIYLGSGNTLLITTGSGADDIEFSAIHLSGDATVELSSTNAIGYQKDFTIDYGTFTADSHGFFDATIDGTLWSNNHTLTLVGELDTSNLTGSGTILLYDASSAAGGINWNTDGLILTESETVQLDLVTTGTSVAINYEVLNVPEASSVLLSVLGLGVLGLRRRR